MHRERQPEVGVQRDRCPYCHDEVAPGPERTACNQCGAWHHTACWGEAGCCSACRFQRDGDSPAAPVAFRCDARGCERPAVHQHGIRHYCLEHTRRDLLFGTRLLLLISLVLGLAAGLALARNDLAPGGSFGVSCLVATGGAWFLNRRRRRLGAEERTEPDPKRSHDGS